MMRAQLLMTSIATLALLAACAADRPEMGNVVVPVPSAMTEAHVTAEAATSEGHTLAAPEPHAPPVGHNAPATMEQAEAKAAEPQPVMEEARRVAECAEGVEARAEFAPLRARSPDPAAMTFKHFADESMPDAGERDLIRRFIEAVEPCRPHFTADTTEVRLIRLAFGNQEKLYAELAAGQLSWGQFNKRTHDLDVLAETEARRLAAR